MNLICVSAGWLISMKKHLCTCGTWWKGRTRLWLEQHVSPKWSFSSQTLSHWYCPSCWFQPKCKHDSSFFWKRGFIGAPSWRWELLAGGSNHMVADGHHQRFLHRRKGSFVVLYSAISKCREGREDGTRSCRSCSCGLCSAPWCE